MAVPPANVSLNGSVAFVWHCKESAVSPGSLAAQYVALDNAFIVLFFFTLAIFFFLIVMQNIFIKEEFRHRMFPLSS